MPGADFIGQEHI